MARTLRPYTGRPILFDRKGDFAALHHALHVLQQAGFAVGPTQRGAPTAVMFGDFAVSKWRNLSSADRLATHAQLTGDNRNGPLTLTMLPAAPEQAMAAFRQMEPA